MNIAEVTETMLYCPKCQSKYPVESRRFCDKDGTRLAAELKTIPASKTQGGVFSNLLGRSAPVNQTDKKLASTPKFTPFNQPQPKTYDTPTPKVPGIIKTEITLEPKIEKAAPKIEKVEKPVEVKPFSRIIKPNEIASGTAEVGDRKKNPTGRRALTWDDPETLIGETVKGRYYITEMLGEDEESISYLAEDKILGQKKVFVRIFMDESEEDLSNVIFAEERVSLSHINHPNIAKVVDSGELPEGKPFLITEYIIGKSIKSMLKRTGQFNALRTGRIIRQAAYALSEAHQNGVLHRNLSPENIFLSVSEAGTEQVILTNFGLLYDSIYEDNLGYKSPEQVAGNLASYASDIYSLGVIAYQMLTNRFPFNPSSVAVLKKSQNAGLTIFPTNLRLDIPPLVDEILTKALSYNPTERYAKARDFGDAFFNALTTAAPWENEEKTPKNVDEEAKEQTDVITDRLVSNEISSEVVVVDEPDFAASEKEEFLQNQAPIEVETEQKNEAGSKELPWKKRSPEQARESGPNWLMFSIFTLGLIIFLGVWYFFLNRPTSPDIIQIPVNNQPSANRTTEEPAVAQTPTPVLDEIETPPNPRKIETPENSTYFENSKQNLEGDLAKNYLGFSLYYPNDWTKNNSMGNFLDISKKSADNLPVKQVLITRYESKGTFNLDKPNFPKLVEKSNKDLRESLPNSIYKVISEGETTIQDGRWKVYEVKFQTSGTINKNGELTLRGRRFWIPIQRPGMKSGFVITLVATSLAPNIQSFDEMITDRELSQILDSFEPAASY